jgi:hypothetical protein
VFGADGGFEGFDGVGEGVEDVVVAPEGVLSEFSTELVVFGFVFSDMDLTCS